MVDNSDYTQLPPPLKGPLRRPLPRLAQRISVEELLMTVVSEADEIVFSGELAGVRADGFLGEQGNFIRG